MSKETMNPVASGDAGAQCDAENHSVLDDHVAGFNPWIEQPRVCLEVGQVGRVQRKIPRS